MTTFTIILITWLIAGLLSFIYIQYEVKTDITLSDLKQILLVVILGYISLTIILIIVICDNITLPKIKLPKGDTVIWKYPKKN